MKLTKMIYIASPYTAKNIRSRMGKREVEEARCWAVDECIGNLQDKYPYAFIGPITMSHRTVQYMKNKETSFKDWARRDLTYISHCDEIWILMIPGWKQSLGVMKEIKFALRNQILIKYIDPVDYSLHETSTITYKV